MDSGWAWVKALVGLSVFEATLVIDSAVLDALLRSERNTLLLLIAVTVANVVLAVWRPRLTYKVR